MHFIVALLALLQLAVGTPRPDDRREGAVQQPRSDTTEILRTAMPGAKIDGDIVYALWPETKEAWEGKQSLEVISVLEGPPLDVGTRLLLVHPVEGFWSNKALVALQGGEILPISVMASLVDEHRNFELARELLNRLLTKQRRYGVDLCALDPEVSAEFVALFTTAADGRDARGLLLSRHALAATPSLFVTASLKSALAAYAREPRVQSNGENCLLSFRLWEGTGSILNYEFKLGKEGVLGGEGAYLTEDRNGESVDVYVNAEVSGGVCGDQKK